MAQNRPRYSGRVVARLDVLDTHSRAGFEWCDSGALDKQPWADPRRNRDDPLPAP